MINRIAKPGRSEDAALRDDFWTASPDAYFSRKAVAAALSMSVSWLEKRAIRGGGPAFVSLGKRKCLYQKRVVIDWFEQYVCRLSTSDATSAGAAA